MPAREEFPSALQEQFVGFHTVVGLLLLFEIRRRLGIGFDKVGGSVGPPPLLDALSFLFCGLDRPSRHPVADQPPLPQDARDEELLVHPGLRFGGFVFVDSERMRVERCPFNADGWAFRGGGIVAQRDEVTVHCDLRERNNRSTANGALHRLSRGVIDLGGRIVLLPGRIEAVHQFRRGPERRPSTCRGAVDHRQRIDLRSDPHTRLFEQDQILYRADGRRDIVVLREETRRGAVGAATAARAAGGTATATATARRAVLVLRVLAKDLVTGDINFSVRLRLVERGQGRFRCGRSRPSVTSQSSQPQAAPRRRRARQDDGRLQRARHASPQMQ